MDKIARACSTSFPSDHFIAVVRMNNKSNFNNLLTERNLVQIINSSVIHHLLLHSSWIINIHYCCFKFIYSKIRKGISQKNSWKGVISLWTNRVLHESEISYSTADQFWKSNFLQQTLLGAGIRVRRTFIQQRRSPDGLFAGKRIIAKFHLGFLKLNMGVFSNILRVFYSK